MAGSKQHQLFVRCQIKRTNVLKNFVLVSYFVPATLLLCSEKVSFSYELIQYYLNALFLCVQSGWKCVKNEHITSFVTMQLCNCMLKR